MEKYFDAFLYFANWGTRWLMFRVPKKLLSQRDLEPYCSNECFLFDEHENNIILSFVSEDDDYEWAEGEGLLTSLMPIRSGLMRGDRRPLYLGWLLAVQYGEIDDEEEEPTVPPGLGSLSASLDSFTEFLRIDSDLIAVAAEHSEPENTAGLSRKEISAWVKNLPPNEKETLLTKLIEGTDQHLAHELRQRVTSEIQGREQINLKPRRTAGDILNRAETIAEERRKRFAQQKAREKALQERQEAQWRKEYLESLAGKEGDVWSKIDDLIATRQPNRYDEAVRLLIDLRALADMQDKSADFLLRMEALCSEHSRKPSLIEKFRNAKLIT